MRNRIILSVILILFAAYFTAFAGNDFHDFKTGKHHNAINIYMPSTDEINVSNIYEAVVWLKNNTLGTGILTNYALKTEVSSEVILHNLTTGAHGLPNPSTNNGKFIKMVDGAFVGAEIQTDRESRANFTAKYALVNANALENGAKWKAKNGFVVFTKQNFKDAMIAINTHVDSCFEAEANKIALIEAAATMVELNAIDLNV